MRGERLQTIIGSDIPTKSGISLGLRYHGFQSPPLIGAQLLPAPVYRDLPANEPLPFDKWSHVAVAFSPTDTKVFLNGKLITKGAPTGTEGGTPFVIGNAGKTNNEHYFVGRMLSARISKGARYVEDFEPPSRFVPDEAAVVIYDAEHVENGMAVDQSGKGNHGKIENVPVSR